MLPINFVKIRNHTFKYTMCYSGDMWDKIHTDGFGHIHGYACIFTHSGVIQEYLGTFWSPSNPGIFRTLTYSEPWYIPNSGIFQTQVYSELWIIQNLGLFRTLTYSEPDRYSEPWHIQNHNHLHNPGIFRNSSIIATLSNICDRAFHENNVNSCLHIFSNTTNFDFNESGGN